MIPVNDIISKYPSFVANQVLTQDQLNNLRTYLDQQNRLTRIRLVGMGIVCGLNVEIGDDFSVTITEGFGITSEGWLIEIPTLKLTHIKAYTDPNRKEGNKIPVYEKWQDNENENKQISLDVLFTPEDDTDTSGSVINPQDLEGKILLLYLQQEKNSLKSCFTTNCNNKGVNITLEVLPILIPHNNGNNRFDLPSFITAKNKKVEYIHVPRFHIGLKIAMGKELHELENAEQLRAGYQHINEHLKGVLADRLMYAQIKYGTFLNLRKETIEENLKKLDVLVNPEKTNTTQYHYDFFKDLVQAYNEFIQAACSYFDSCCLTYNFEQREFIRHLQLGKFVNDNGNLTFQSICRHFFYPSPVQNVNQKDLEQVKCLFERMLSMINSFNVPTTEGIKIKITPSQTEFYPLEKRAIPYYYDYDALVSKWIPSLCCKPTALSYTLNDQEEVPTQGSGFLPYLTNPLQYNMLPHTFYRIEGHLGKDTSKVLHNLMYLRSTHNLEFKLIVLHLNQNSSETESRINENIEKKFNEIIELRHRIDRLVEENESISDLLKQVVDKDSEIRQVLIKDWMNFRNSQLLICNISSLQFIYHSHRSQLLGISQQIIPLLSISYSKFVDVANVKSPVLRQLYNKLSYLNSLVMNLHTIHLLPIEFRHFNLIYFSKYFKLVIDTVIQVKLYIHLILLEREDNILLDDFPRWEDLMHNLNQLQYHCHLFPFVKLYYNLNYVFKQNSFNAFTKSHKGLEHLAGVEKGGNFILVSEKKENTELIVADFALHASSCCCEVDINDEDICFPPVASSDYYIIDLDNLNTQEGNFRLSSGWDGLAGNDVNLQWDQNKGIITIPRESVLGVPLEKNETNLSINYLLSKIDEPSSLVGKVDSFTYTLQNHECGLQDTGTVWILIKGERVLPQLGGIEGRVVVADPCAKENIPVTGARVELRREPLGSPIDTRITDTNGDFIFENLDVASNYRITFEYQCFRAKQNAISVEAGEIKGLGDITLVMVRPSRIEPVNTINITDKDLIGGKTHNWTKDNVYIIDGLVYLEDDGTLIIEPGTVIKGKKVPSTGGQASALIITRGARIFAEGTASQPIIFTGYFDDISETTDINPYDNRLWGGLIILGNAPIGEDRGIDVIEGIPSNEPRIVYGGTNPNDNSGILRYVSIRHGGFNEISGLALAGVGSQTIIEYVEVFACSMNGFEFLGGTVNAKYLVSAFNQGRAFVIAAGYKGKGQFWFGIQKADTSYNGIEIYGLANQNINADLVASGPTIYNATLIGTGAKNQVSSSIGIGIGFRNRAGTIANSLISGFSGYGLTLVSKEFNIGKEIFINNNVWWDFGSGNTFEAIISSINNEEIIDYLLKNGNVLSDPLVCSISRNPDLRLDPRIRSNDLIFGKRNPILDLPLAEFPTNDDFFEKVGYHGAFALGKISWLHCWTALSEYGYLAGTSRNLRPPVFTSEFFKNMVTERNTRLRNALNQLRDRPAFRNSNSLAAGANFVEKAISAPSEELNEAFDATTTSLLLAYRSESKENKPFYESTLKAVTHAYIDRIVGENPAELMEPTEIVLKEHIKKLQNDGHNVEAVFEAWEVMNLDETQDQDSIKRIQSLFKAE